MRILHAPHAYAPVIGGAEILCKRVGEELVKRGHRVRVAAPRFASPEVFYSVGIGRVERLRETIRGVDVERLGYGGATYRIAGMLPERWGAPVARSLRRHWNAAFQKRLQAELEEWKPDVVTALPHLFPNVQAMINLRREARFPLLVVPLLHEQDLDLPIFAQALGRADGVIALTNHEAAQLADGFGVEPERVFVCRPGVDLPNGPDVQHRGRTDTVAYLGRLTPQKGIELLLIAMSYVWQYQPTAELILAGASTPSTPAVEQLVAMANGPVAIKRDITDDQKTDLLGRIAVAVLPSQRESFGLSILDAWAHATPVVAVDIPVMAEIVTRDAGVLVRQNDAHHMGTAIADLLRDDNRRATMAAAGRSKVANMTWSRAAVDWERAYARTQEKVMGPQ